MEKKYILKLGREILIKTVAQAIPTYSMSLFKLPKVLYEEINSILAEYRWGQLRNEKKIHWIKWSNLCEPKAKEGVGFRDLNAFNLVMLAKRTGMALDPSSSLFAVQGLQSTVLPYMLFFGGRHKE